MLITLLMLAGGIGLLALGGNYLVDGAAALAKRMGLSPLFIGLTFVGLGTSVPELATSIAAVAEGSDGIALGNIVGSNIANIMLVAGATALLFGALPISRTQLVRDGGFGILAALLFVIALNTTQLVAPWGVLFFLLLFAYLIYTFQAEKAVYKAERGADNQTTHAAAAPESVTSPTWVYIALAVGGIIAVIVGAELTVKAAINIASALGVSDTVIGLTVVAVGTSLPEIVASFIAAARGMAAMALGNILGSNIFNLVLIGGTMAFVSSHHAPVALSQIDGPVALGAAIALFVLAYPKSRIGSVAGAALLAAYVTYISSLLIR